MSVLVLGRERDRGDHQVDRGGGHRGGLLDGVVSDQQVPLPAGLLARDADRAAQAARQGLVGQAVGADQLPHPRHELVVLRPPALQPPTDLPLRGGVDEVDADRAGLEEALNPMDRLEDFGEFEADPDEDGPVAVPLEVAPRAREHRLGGQVLGLAVGEVDDPPLALVEVLAAPHADRVGQRGLDRVPLGLQVVPEQEVLVGTRGDDLAQLGDAGLEAVAALAGGLRHAERGVAEQVAAARPVEVAAGRGLGGDLVPADLQRGQLVARGVVAQICWGLQEQRPRGDPRPEGRRHVRQQGEPVGVLRVALEEARLALPDVEDVEERGVGEQLEVLVRRGRRGGHEAVAGGALVQAHQLPERLGGAEAAQDRRLVQRDHLEAARVEPAVPHRLVVGEVDAVREGLGVAADEPRGEPEEPRVADELLAHAERAHDQPAAAAELGEDQPHDLELLDGLAEPERLEEGPPAAAHGPHHGIALVGQERRVDLARVDLQAGGGRELRLRREELVVGAPGPGAAFVRGGGRRCAVGDAPRVPGAAVSGRRGGGLAHARSSRSVQSAAQARNPRR